ncbi:MULTISPECIES: chitinase [Streptomyces]|nr:MULTISPECIES: chitinase [Streptomyces]KQX85185.1 hydrolase [Streptomyces sp. Root1319]KQZ17488.1 hydrolase [Streptomyces sp. Root55]MDX2742343.1 chitinase [Streptomyces sp. NRRL_B-2557]MDX3063608.1 chitinase [Streptomyces sp. ND04-05B]WRY86886.1 chitinase [Streptomyces clavifer]
MQRRTRVPSVVAGLVALGLACSACATGTAAYRTDGAGASPPRAPQTAYTPYVSATTAADTDGAASPDTYNLAFVTSDGSGCTPVWGGTEPATSDAVVARAAALTDTGADLRVSFGGAAGTEAALDCDSAQELADAYAEILDAVGATKADFDIEGDALTDEVSVARRNEALALLQKERDLDLTYTLPVMPDGLEDTGLAVVQDAVDQGVRLSAVNIMAMNYSSSHSGDMGDYAEQAAQAAHDQLVDVLGLSRDAAWQALHLTVMIGVNDVAGETFTLADAASLRDFATRKGVGALSMWAAFRDRPCAEGEDLTEADDACSGVAQEPGAFAEALNG